MLTRRCRLRSHAQEYRDGLRRTFHPRLPRGGTIDLHKPAIKGIDGIDITFSPVRLAYVRRSILGFDPDQHGYFAKVDINSKVIVLSFVDPYVRWDRGHGHSIEEGAVS